MFDYGNARLRAMKSRLLPRAALENLAEAGSVNALLTALLDTPYGPGVQTALVRFSGLECLSEALRADLALLAGRARRFFSGAAGELAALALRAFDVRNVVAVLRGLARQAAPDEILAATLPAGELRPADLRELAGAPDVPAAIGLLATWRVPLAQPLLAARPGRGAAADVFQLELRLLRWRLDSALQAAQRARGPGEALAESLVLEADALNLLTVLRLRAEPEAAAALRGLVGADDPALLFVGPGRVSFRTLRAALDRPSVAAAVEALARTPYGAALAGALEAYRAEPALSVFERALSGVQLRHALGLFLRDPLGSGVLVGWLALKANELANLRALGQGLALGARPDEIRAGLLFAEA